ncbi:MAG TPA: hypothetical protein PKY59_25460 [Pyrinomonadaceae bacterium]|nr:hypothetical protein [Pyrinomonadaceae bacterium]
MKNRLKNKLKAKKTLGNNGDSFRKQQAARPAKKVYPMSAEYNKNLQTLTQLLDEREEYKREIAFLPPEKKAEAFAALGEFDKSLNNLEQKLAEEYDKQQSNEKHKEKLFARIYENMQRTFIVAKHRFKPEDFAAFEKSVLKKMTPAAKKEFYELVAHRESYDLENILADPNGRVKRPLKHPQIQLTEAIFDIDRIAYETDKDFQEAEAEYERILKIRDEAEQDLWLLNPEDRPKRRAEIENLDRMNDQLLPKMISYLQACFAEDGKVERKKPDQKKLDAAFERAEIASDRLFLFYKHLKPHLFEKYQETAFATMTPEEIEETKKRIAKREAEELDEILASAGGKREETVENKAAKTKNDEDKMKIVKNG